MSEKKFEELFVLLTEENQAKLTQFLSALLEEQATAPCPYPDDPEKAF